MIASGKMQADVISQVKAALPRIGKNLKPPWDKGL
jgi:hypothetical protein